MSSYFELDRAGHYNCVHPIIESHIGLFCCNFFSGPNFVFKKVRFWRSYEFPSVIGTSVVKSYCPNCLYFWGDFLGEGVNDSICVENLDLEPKMTSTIWCYDVMIISSDEMLIWWYDDIMILWYYDIMVSWDKNFPWRPRICK